MRWGSYVVACGCRQWQWSGGGGCWHCWHWQWTTWTSSDCTTGVRLHHGTTGRSAASRGCRRSADAELCGPCWYSCCCPAGSRYNAVSIRRKNFLCASAFTLRRSVGSIGITFRTLDLRSKVREFDYRSGCHRVLTTRMGDCLWTGKPSQYITITKVNSAFRLSGVGKSGTGLLGWG